MYNKNLEIQSKDNIFLVNTKVPYIKSVQLYINNSLKPKFIGHLNLNEKIFRTKRNNFQIHRKTNSIAFNYRLVSEFDIEIFKVEYDGKFLYICKEYLLKVGRIYEFKNGGAELQIFCPISEFSHSIQEAKSKLNSQLNFFGKEVSK